MEQEGRVDMGQVVIIVLSPSSLFITNCQLSILTAQHVQNFFGGLVQHSAMEMCSSFLVLLSLLS